MADFFEEVEKAFNTRCFYTVLGLDKENCDEKSIKKAYYKQSLLCHPDRCISEQQKESSKLKFQILTKIHSVLSNKEHKAVYDETGQLVDEGDLCQQNKDWEAYWRILYKKVLKSDIEEFEKEYKGSEEEAEVVRNCYVKFEGNMESILDNVMCATIDDEERFRKIIQEGIKKKKLPKFNAYSNESEDKKNKRKKAAEKEAKESEELAKELGINADGGLKNLILARNASREKEMDSFFDNLAAKYAQPKKKKGGNSKPTTNKARAKKAPVGTKAKGK